MKKSVNGTRRMKILTYTGLTVGKFLKLCQKRQRWLGLNIVYFVVTN